MRAKYDDKWVTYSTYILDSLESCGKYWKYWVFYWRLSVSLSVLLKVFHDSSFSKQSTNKQNVKIYY